jgi:hypothetical protein
MDITTVGVDLAKNLITVYAVDRTGKMVCVRDLRRQEFAAGLCSCPPAA